MRILSSLRPVLVGLLIALFCFPAGTPPVTAAEKDDAGKAGGDQGPPPAPVRTAPVVENTVADQITLIGTTSALARSTVASEFSGVVQAFPVKAGDFVAGGDLLVALKDDEMRLRLESYVAERERVRANLENAERELKRLEKLHRAGSISDTSYDTARYARLALSKAFLKSQAEIDLVKYQIDNRRVFAPFAGVVIEEHTQVGEWIQTGGAVVTLWDVSQVLVRVDVPERYALKIPADGAVRVVLKSVADTPFEGSIYAMLFEGDAVARTLPVQVRVDNPDFRIRGGMEAQVAFNLTGTREALLVPKDAVVTAGGNRLVYAVVDGRSVPVGIEVLGYYGGDVAVSGDLEAGMAVVIRGNERLRPGQAVTVIE